MICLKEIKKSYNGRIVLDIDDLLFERGKIYAVLGPNGSGKSTLVKIIKGIEKPDSGEVLYTGKKEMDFAYLPQKPYMFNFSVLKNIMMGIANKDDALKKAKDALKQVGLENLKEARACSLSGGEAQRVATARILVLDKEVVLLDEPAAAVDVSSIHLVENYIKKANKENKTTFIITTHNPSQAIRLADEAIFLFEGRVYERGEPEKLFKNPEKSETISFLANWRI
ncbi:ABC transporter ATP-binding protein [Pseudobacteroides cellulosolvens]|uniref:Fe(3+)-transporting ATPase n=1 Tax=Pseudobacteroides cellulosolvens ATCC 35603 = DSM 2933 TaxID=398512 RepID=A0A0L6JRD8_9FIRM|nr:ATP-binding cassette domain-containing protein [Pseudobacteroides cellulosolvens]KNY28411.1 Fe(3+)-transporting ATPase [Pseudobacteroides cellulosolvens ATCC 35603 = DSM 2933]